MGPHGLVIGATGSGKSELLRTLVLGLALTHSSETLNFVLVDFKGGATFASLDVLPHTSAVITNLEDELTLVDRMKDAIQGETGAPAGAAARGRQLRLGARLRARPRAGRAAGADAVAVRRRRRVQRAAVGQAGLHRPVRHDRPARPLARRAPAAGLAAPGGGQAARAGHPPVLPDRAAHVLRRREPRRARRARRLRAAQRAGQRLPQGGDRGAGAVQGGLRLRRLRRAAAAGARNRSRRAAAPGAALPARARRAAGRAARAGTRARGRGRRSPAGPGDTHAGHPGRAARGRRHAGPQGVAAAAGRAADAGRADAAAGRDRARPAPGRLGPRRRRWPRRIGLIDRPFDQRRDPTGSTWPARTSSSSAARRAARAPFCDR